MGDIKLSMACKMLSRFGSLSENARCKVIGATSGMLRKRPVKYFGGKVEVLDAFAAIVLELQPNSAEHGVNLSILLC